MDTSSNPINPTTTTGTRTEALPRGPLTDAELLAEHPAVAALVTKLEGIADDAPYMSDPRQGSKRIALALAEYFRTPDAL